MRRVALAAAFTALSFALSATAFAAEPEPPSDKVKAAKALFEEGFKLMRQHDYENARVRFLGSQSLNDKNAHNLWNLAVCEFETKRFVEATQHFRDFVHHPEADPPHIAEANTDFISKALPHIGQIQIIVPGASAKVDGREGYAASALVDPIPVAPGKHHVEVDNGRIVKDVDVSAGQTVTVAAPEPPPDRPAPAAAPPSPIPTAPPAPSARGIAEEGEPQPATPGILTTGRKIGIGIGVAAVAVAGVGVGFGIAASNADGSASSFHGSNSSCASASSARCASLSSSVNTATSDAPVATGLLIGGGALAVGAIVVWLLASPHPTHSGWLLVPAVDRTGAGFHLSSDF